MNAPASGNAILRSLPDVELSRLEPYLKPLQLTAGQRLAAPHEPLSSLCFPLEGALSRVVHLFTGETVEAGIVGNDGVVGLPIALGGSQSLGVTTVQLAGSALAISASDFDEHVRGKRSPLFDALMLYTNLYISVLSQLTACHCVHRIEQRLSRCLLTLDDRGAKGSLRITHDTLAEFLGVHRPSVTYALQSIAETGALSAERRRIIIRDRRALESHACECYAAICRATERGLETMARAGRP